MMKLIDILNLIVKGELEEGTKIKLQGTIYTFGEDDYSCGRMDLFCVDSDGIKKTLFDKNFLSAVLNEEVEIIGKDTKGNIKELSYKLEELENPSYNESWLMNCVRANRDKLNEVIQELNRRCE